jgi:predicted nucleotidyltransferase
MADRKIIEIAERYFALVKKEGIPLKALYLFGSHVRDTAGKWSDIDLLAVLSDELSDREFSRVSTRLWTLARAVDTRIEPLAITEGDWIHDEATPVILVVRSEGIRVAA